MLLSILACIEEVKDTGATDTADADTDTDTDSDTDTDTGTDTGTDTLPTMALVATVADDYSAGVLATVSLADWSVADSITTSPTDVGLDYDDGAVYLMGRWGSDYVRKYAPGSWDEPTWEVSTGTKSNPYVARECDGKLFVTLYGRKNLGVYDPATGVVAGTVDLSAYDDGDGYPEASSMVESDGKLYIALNQLDQDNRWAADGGKIVEVDCASMTVTQDWSAEPNPSIGEWPGVGMVVTTGVYDVAGDGAVYSFSPGNGLSAALWTETAEVGDLAGAAMVDATHGIVLTTDADSVTTARCYDSGTTAAVMQTNSYISGVVPVGDGTTVWVLGRYNYANPDSSGGIAVIDAQVCADLTASGWLTLGFSPSAVAFY